MGTGTGTGFPGEQPHASDHLSITKRARRPIALRGAAQRVNTIFVSLLASCQLHGIDPWAYLRDIFCLLHTWPARRVLELAPAYWKQTLEQEDTQQRLAANVFRTVTLAEHHANV